jgi:hypothetical protein
MTPDRGATFLFLVGGLAIGAVIGVAYASTQVALASATASTLASLNAPTASTQLQPASFNQTEPPVGDIPAL